MSRRVVSRPAGGARLRIEQVDIEGLTPFGRQSYEATIRSELAAMVEREPLPAGLPDRIRIPTLCCVAPTGQYDSESAREVARALYAQLQFELSTRVGTLPDAGLDRDAFGLGAVGEEGTANE